jgi:NAD(P)-dependent dehydrogenase (short-subunit alcohol dehydrogenase family)
MRFWAFCLWAEEYRFPDADRSWTRPIREQQTQQSRSTIANAAAEVFRNASFEVSVANVDVSSRQAVQALVATATSLGEVTGLIHAAGVSPSQASPETILKVDLYGTALVLEEFGKVIANGGSGVVIASQSGHRLPASFHLLS